MAINYYENNKKLIEKKLEKTINEIFRKLKMGLADWDFNDILRDALKEPSNLDKIKDVIRVYDETFALSIKTNIKINDKYKVLYQLDSGKNTKDK